MTAKYFAILTNYGAAQLANAVALGTQMNISAMAVGDGGGTLPVPDPAQTKLVRETRRAAVNQVSIDEKNPNFIIAEQVIPENEGGWFIREIGLFDDNGGLIAVGNAPETYKPNLQEGSGRTQVIQMVLMVSSTQAITLKVDPSVVLATREYVTKSIDAAIQASEARAAQTYQPKGDYVLHPYLKLEMTKKVDKADITQQLGNDPSKVGSQLLLTEQLGKKASVADVNSKLAKDQNGADIPDKPKFIENLGLGEAAILPAANGSLSGNGWCKFPLTQGKTLIIQWGEVNVSKQDQVAQLPIAFPATILQAVSSDSGGSAFSVGISGRGNTELIFRVDNSRFLNGQNVVCRYIAIGF